MCVKMFHSQYYLAVKVIHMQCAYTGCLGGNVPDFGKMFLKLKYTDTTKNTYTRSWTVTEIMARKKCRLVAVPRTVPVSRDALPVHCACPSFSLQPGQELSLTLRLQYQQLSLLQLIVRRCKNAFVFSHVDYCDMHFVYGFWDGNARAAVDEYQRCFPDRRIPSRRVFSCIHQTMR